MLRCAHPFEYIRGKWLPRVRHLERQGDTTVVREKLDKSFMAYDNHFDNLSFSLDTSWLFCDV